MGTVVYEENYRGFQITVTAEYCQDYLKASKKLYSLKDLEEHFRDRGVVVLLVTFVDPKMKGCPFYRELIVRKRNHPLFFWKRNKQKPLLEETIEALELLLVSVRKEIDEKIEEKQINERMLESLAKLIRSREERLH